MAAPASRPEPDPRSYHGIISKQLRIARNLNTSPFGAACRIMGKQLNANHITHASSKISLDRQVSRCPQGMGSGRSSRPRNARGLSHRGGCQRPQTTRKPRLGDARRVPIPAGRRIYPYCDGQPADRCSSSTIRVSGLAGSPSHDPEIDPSILLSVKGFFN